MHMRRYRLAVNVCSYVSKSILDKSLKVHDLEETYNMERITNEAVVSCVESNQN